MRRDLDLGGGRGLHVYDTGAVGTGPTVVRHHGTPNLGAPPVPLLPPPRAATHLSRLRMSPSSSIHARTARS